MLKFFRYLIFQFNICALFTDITSSKIQHYFGNIRGHINTILWCFKFLITLAESTELKNRLFLYIVELMRLCLLVLNWVELTSFVNPFSSASHLVSVNLVHLNSLFSLVEFNVKVIKKNIVVLWPPWPVNPSKFHLPYKHSQLQMFLFFIVMSKLFHSLMKIFIDCCYFEIHLCLTLQVHDFGKLALSYSNLFNHGHIELYDTVDEDTTNVALNMNSTYKRYGCHTYRHNKSFRS